MELTINIIEKKKIAFFLNLIKEFDYIEIIGVNEDDSIIPIEHQELLNERLERIGNGKASFKSWNLIKEKYAKRAI